MIFIDFYTVTQPTSLTFPAPLSSQAGPANLFLRRAFILAEFSTGTLSPGVLHGCFIPIIRGSVLFFLFLINLFI